MRFGLIESGGTTMVCTSITGTACEDEIMANVENGPRPQTESEFYYQQVPAGPRPVGLPVEFLTATEFLEDEPACKALWELISTQFKTRSKFLAIWASVRYVAIHRRNGKVVGLLLVSAPVNWQIDYVVVDPDWRGRGIAEALVNQTVNQARARNVPYVMLTSREGLRPLYEGACGFTVVGQKKGPRIARELKTNQKAVLHSA
jgi:ribosomal protein S18 acetylase RimI-like enzyme